jgi:acyl-CoA thioesterase I
MRLTCSCAGGGLEECDDLDQATEEPASIRIMPLGDSITCSVSRQSSCRYWLWDLLYEAGHAVDFVGDLSGVRYGSPGNADFDQDHSGHWGWRADTVASHVVRRAREAEPEIVLLHIGTNDMIWRQSINSTLDAIAGIIFGLRSVDPDIRVVLAQIIPSQSARLNERIEQLNARIPVLAGRLTTERSPVVVVDHWSALDPRVDLRDRVHPNTSGERKLAVAWFDALDQIIGSVEGTGR